MPTGGVSAEVTQHQGRDQRAAEVARLERTGLPRLGYTEAMLWPLAEITLEIQRLKQARRAVIPAHVYQRPEIVHGVADFVGDSLVLSERCRDVAAEEIVFCGVRFMAETAKILNPAKRVYLPAPEAGCSLAESVTAEDVRRLKAAYPGVPAVCYINTTAEVKAECEAVVTSANARAVLGRLLKRHGKLLFLPDELMGYNLARELGITAAMADTAEARQAELVIWKGRCIVHEQFDDSWVERTRREFSGIKILVHTECAPALVEAVDFSGGTGGMMRYVEQTSAPAYMLVTECGLGELARSRFPEKTFVPMCRLCPYMKATDLSRVAAVLREPLLAEEIIVPEPTAQRARASLEAMFELMSS